MHSTMTIPGFSNRTALPVPMWPWLLLLLGLFTPVLHAQGAASTETLGTFGGPDLVVLLIYVTVALVVSFLCSIAEAVLLSVSPAFIAGLQDTQPKRAEALKRLKTDNIDRSLAAILTLNTIAHTLGAIGAGAKATVVFGSAWFGVFSAVMTLLILFLSEIVPKTLGAVYWRHLTGFTTGFVNLLILSLYPLILVSEKLTKLIARGQDVHVFSREEFVAMASVGEEAGHLNERESKIIGNLFRFGSLRAVDIMTPRVVVSGLQQDLTVTRALESKPRMQFSRVPIYGESLDAITGFVLREDLLLAKTQGRGDAKVLDFKRQILSVAAPMRLSDLMETLLGRRQHIAVVIGEYGETEGIVTLEDVLETLLGIEILDEGDKVEDMQGLARQLWHKRAKALGIELEVDGDPATGAAELPVGTRRVTPPSADPPAPAG
jgi:CBS domain containing-hemolysin-like protein